MVIAEVSASKVEMSVAFVNTLFQFFISKIRDDFKLNPAVRLSRAAVRLGLDKIVRRPLSSLLMNKRSPFDSNQIMRRAEDLINAASNRYRITVQVANRAQRRRFEEFDNLDDPKMKPVLRAIIEMSDELTQPEIIGE